MKKVYSIEFANKMSDPTPTSEHLTISSRAYSYIKQMAVRTVEDAVVELVTNADDAYDKAMPAILSRDIEIEAIPRTATEPQKLVVRDHAIGMSGADMVTKLLQVGNYTSTQDSRGFFSRGAKDITSLGDALFESIKDGKYSKVGIDKNSMATTYVLDREVTPEIRADVGILQGNGLKVTLALLSQYWINDPFNHLARVRANYALRDIFANSQNNVNFKLWSPEGFIAYETRIVYQFPEYEEVVFDREYIVPGYEHVTAHFTLYRCEKKLQEKSSQNELEFGVLIQSGKVLHENTFIKPYLRHHVAMPYLYGRIRCDHINDLMYDLETGGRSDANPFTVLDPSRRTGVNVDHPFIRQLYSVPGLLLDVYVKQLASKLIGKELSSKTVSNLIQNLEIFTSELIHNNDVFSAWLEQSRGEAEMIRALVDVHKNYVDANPNAIEMRCERTDEMPHDNYNSTIREFIFDKPSEATLQTLEVRSRGTLEQIEEPLPDQPYVKATKDKPIFHIRFTDQEDPPYRYQIYKNQAEIVMTIHLKDHFVAQYFQINSVTGQIDVLETSNSIILADMLTEALARLLVNLEIEEGQFDLNVGNSLQAASDIFRRFEMKVAQVDNIVSSAVQYWLEHKEDLNDGIEAVII